jgi:5-methylcytosine-specific restriction endonuclease McrA
MRTFKQGEYRKCPVCEKSFYVFPGQVEIRRFCSSSCAITFHKPWLNDPSPAQRAVSQRTIKIAKQRQREMYPPRPPLIQVCIQCENEFVQKKDYPSHLARNHRYCSTDCWYEWSRQHRYEHPRKSKLPAVPMGPGWKAQAKRARERDGHTCQECGLHQVTPSLQVHHLVPRRQFGDDYATANHLDNLVTLCNSCHMRAEATLIFFKG